MMHLSSLCSIFFCVHITLLLLITCISLSQQVSRCYDVCCPLFSVLSTPSRSRQMAALPESGSDGGFFLLKEVFSSFFLFFPQLPYAHTDRGLDRREVSVQSVGFLSEAIFLCMNKLDQFGIELIWLDNDCIRINCILINFH